MSISPDFDAFAARYDAGTPQVVSTKLVADLDTPVSAYLTLAERKVIGYMQVRLGPNRVSLLGIDFLRGWGQPIADALKLMSKEIVVPNGANTFLFLIAPVVAQTLTLPVPAFRPPSATFTAAR